MASFSISGKLILIEPPVPVSAKFIKRNFVIETSEEFHGVIYFEFITFSLTQSKISLLDLCEVGKDYIVNFNVRGRKFEKDGKLSYFNSLECWSIAPNYAAGLPSTASPKPYPVTDSVVPTTASDDLPY
ncbi:MAG: hypothetical protein A2W17_06195 [Planctomycetes bacterium RBG_16_41_13]|nr:MAG: hypothetical protein A2W17_06195 [Planctomycetes bacterium RBG_16_41_13]